MRRFRWAALAAVAVAGLVSVLVGNSNSLMAQTTDVSAKTDQELAKENAELRSRINRLELERQNAELRDHVRRLETEKGGSVVTGSTTVAPKRTAVAPSRTAAAPSRSKKPALRAFAADMPVKATIAPAVVASNWNGFYVGGQLGAKWLTNDWNTTCVQGGGLFFTCGSDLNAIIFPGQPDSSAANSFKTSGLRTGIYAGVMAQLYPNWVVGAESDYAFYHESSTVGGLLGCSTLACANNAGLGPPLDPNALVNDSTRIKDKSDFSLRLRAGYLVTPDILFYGTGGVAFQHVEATMTCNGSTSPACLFNHSQTSSATLVGYTVGGGLEWKLAPNWLLRGEYRYADYGSYKPSFFVGSGDLEVFANVKVKSQIATAGLAYMVPIPR